MTETSAPMDILDEVDTGDGDVAKWILPLIFPELNARTLQEKGSQHLLQDNVARLAGHLQAVASNVTAYSEALQTQWRAIAALAKGQGQTTSDMRELRALVGSLVEGVTDVARQQAAVRSAVQDNAKVMSASTEAVGQGQSALKAEVEKVMEAARQTLAALTATAAEQTAVHEMLRRVMEAVTGVAARQTAFGEAMQAHEQAGGAWAGRQEQLANDVRRLHDLTQTVAGGVADVVREQAATRGAMQETARVMGATTEAIGQGQRTLQAEVEKMVQTTQQAVTALTATAAEQTAAHETIRRVSEEVTGIAARQTACGEAVQAHEQASAAALAALTGRQEQLAGDVRRIHDLTQTVAGGVADVAREQAAVRSAVQDSTKVMSATTEAIQQGQRTLQTEVEKLAETTRQTAAALTATAAEQTAVHETVRRVGEELTGVAARQTALSEATQAHQQASAALAGSVAEVAREQAAVRDAVHESTKVMGATADAIGQSQRTLQTEMEEMAETTRQTVTALTATAAEQTATHEMVRRTSEELTGIAARQTALSETVQAHEQASAALAGSVAEVAREQAAVRSAVQDSTKVVSATTEALGQSLRTLQTEMEKIVDTTRQSIAALTAVTAEQTAVHEAVRRVGEGLTGVAARQAALSEAVQAHERDSTKAMSATTETMVQGLRALGAEMEKVVETTKQTLTALAATTTEQTTGHEITRRMIGEVANAAMAALAAGQGRLTGNLPQLEASTPAAADLGSPEVGPFGPTAEGDHSQRLSAAKAITHGEQIRYEVGPDRDNLGFWTHASDWAQWELDITRPGRFKVTAQIAALAPGRFQVICGDQKLDASALNTGDYGRFQTVELGIMEFSSCGKTQVAVRPIPEGWQPMNLKALDFVPLP